MSEERTGGPRQRVQGSRRRSRRDAGDGVGESWRPSHFIRPLKFGGVMLEMTVSADLVGFCTIQPFYIFSHQYL